MRAFAIAALLEMAGCFAFWVWMRRGVTPFLLVLGIANLVSFALALTPVDSAFAGRAYAAYGGIYIAASLVWLWLVEGQSPTRTDLPARHSQLLARWSSSDLRHGFVNGPRPVPIAASEPLDDLIIPTRSTAPARRCVPISAASWRICGAAPTRQASPTATPTIRRRRARGGCAPSRWATSPPPVRPTPPNSPSASSTRPTI